jgi:transcriptional regulator with XRE-family HTH domain
MSGFLSAVREELPNKEFRENYVAENVRRGLAYQIKALREARGWLPAEFARRAGLPQSNISRWENPTYGKFNLSTLIEIASVFDVALSVRFVGFEELLISLSDLRPQTLAVPSYENEQKEREVGSDVGDAARALADTMNRLFREPPPPPPRPVSLLEPMPLSPFPTTNANNFSGRELGGRPA